MTTHTEIIEQFTEKWNERGDIGLTKQEILDFLHTAHLALIEDCCIDCKKMLIFKYDIRKE